MLKNKKQVKEMLLKSTAAIIGSLGHNRIMIISVIHAWKDWAESLYTDVGSPTIRFRDEVLPEIIIPFGNLDAVDIDLNFTNDYEVTYFSVVPVSYYGFTQTALEMVSAQHSSFGDVSSLLSQKDQNYAYLDSTGIVTMQFFDETTPQQGMVRDYILEVNGYYTIPQLDNKFVHPNLHTQKPDNSSHTSIPFKLHINYPNPFNPSTSKMQHASDANTSVKIYNALGRLWRTR
jgi:hypothetical protein